MLEGKQHQVNRLLQAHNKPGHGRLGDGDGVAGFDLINPQGNNRATATHNIPIAGAADLGLAGHPGFGNGHLFFNGLGHTHGVDGIGRFVRRQADHALYALVDGSGQHIVRSDNVGSHCLHGEELTGGHLLQRSRMEDIVHAVHSGFHRLQIPHIANIELDLVRHFRHLYLKLVAHIILLLLIPGEDADFTDVGLKESIQNSVSEGTGSAGNHQGFVFKQRHNSSPFLLRHRIISLLPLNCYCKFLAQMLSPVCLISVTL